MPKFKRRLLISFILIFNLVLSFASVAQERISMTLEKSGVYTIPCEVNGLKLRFVFDTGAADVHLSLVEAAFMLKNGYIDENDFIGSGTYTMADGSILENAMVNLRTIKIGNTVIRNVKACISSKINASLLLGQSAIQKMGSYSIDGSTLILSKKNVSNDSYANTTTSSADSIIYDTDANIMPSNFTGNGKKVYSTGDVVECSFKDGLASGFGKYTSKDGKYWYEGEFNHGKMSGKGRMYASGVLMEGVFKDGELNGYGKAVWDDGTIYTGSFVDGWRTGRGKIIYENGNSYEGDFEKGKRCGNGTFKWKDGDKYSGSYVDNNREGYGTYTWANGEKFVGYSVNNKFEGKGTRYYNNGAKYVGEFSNDEIEGFGTLTWPSGNKYVGNFHNGQFSGTGTYYWSDKDKYEGDWKEGEQTGVGTFYYSDGRRYEGEFVNGSKSGKGTYIWPSGDKYIGDFKDGYRSGYGTYYWKSGNRYTGYWLKGERNGEGTYYFASGGSKTGTWKDGELVSDSPTLSYDLSDNATSYRKDRYDNNSYDGAQYKKESYNDDYNYSDNSNSYNYNTYEDVDYYLAQATIDLNLREGPGTNYDIVSKIPRGNYVFLSTADAEQSFRKVLYVDKNISGYVSSAYLTNFRKVEEDASGNLQIESRNYKNTADIKIENQSSKKATIAIGKLSYTFQPYQTRTIKDIKPGKYKTMASAPGVTPFVGYDNVEGGYEYSWVFYIKATTR